MTKRKAPDPPCRCDACRTNAIILGMSAVAQEHAAGYMNVVMAALRIAMFAAGVDPLQGPETEARLLEVLLPDLQADPGASIH